MPYTMDNINWDGIDVFVRCIINHYQSAFILVNDNTRVIRACGWIPNDEQFKDRECYTKSGTNQVK